MPTYFVSGSPDITYKEFNKQYIPLLNKGLFENATFIVSDLSGVDSMTQQYLIGKTNKVIVFHTGDNPKILANIFYKTEGGYKSSEEKEAAMLLSSDADIIWTRSKEEQEKHDIKYKKRTVAKYRF